MSPASHSRSVGAVILAILAAVAGVMAVIDVLRFLNILPVAVFGPVQLYGFNLFGAVLYGLVAVVWFWTASKLWNQDKQGWMIMVWVAIIYLLLDVFSLFSGTPFWSLFPSILINALILIIANLPSTTEGFDRL